MRRGRCKTPDVEIRDALSSADKQTCMNVHRQSNIAPEPVALIFSQRMSLAVSLAEGPATVPHLTASVDLSTQSALLLAIPTAFLQAQIERSWSALELVQIK